MRLRSRIGFKPALRSSPSSNLSPSSPGDKTNTKGALKVNKRNQSKKCLTPHIREKIARFTKQYSLFPDIHGSPGGKKMMRSFVNYINEDFDSDVDNIPLAKRVPKSKNDKTTVENLAMWLAKNKKLRKPFWNAIPLGEKGKGPLANDTGKETASMRLKKSFLHKNFLKLGGTVTADKSVLNNDPKDKKLYKVNVNITNMQGAKLVQVIESDSEWNDVGESVQLAEDLCECNMNQEIEEIEDLGYYSIPAQDSPENEDSNSDLNILNNLNRQQPEKIVVMVDPPPDQEYGKEIEVIAEFAPGPKTKAPKPQPKPKRKSKKAPKNMKNKSPGQGLPKQAVGPLKTIEAIESGIHELSESVRGVKVQHVSKMLKKVRQYCAQNEELTIMIPVLEASLQVVDCLNNYRK